MPFNLSEIIKAYFSYLDFKKKSVDSHHERYIFPLFCGTYFVYRKIDILRIVAIAKSLSSKPTYVDIGCGNCDFLEKILEYIPNAIGIEMDLSIYYLLGKKIPKYVISLPVENINNRKFDLSFVGWMEHGIDFRKNVAKFSKCIVTTFDIGGQCGINGGCDYDDFGFSLVASWKTPSWIDVNTELLNKYYTLSNDVKKYEQLSKFRTAHNLWYIYSDQENYSKIKNGLIKFLEFEEKLISTNRYDFETILDELGFKYGEKLSIFSSDKNINKTNEQLWKVVFHH